MSRQADWLSRHNLVDVYPRKDDPFIPGAGNVPTGAPGASFLEPSAGIGEDIYDKMTIPSQRPTVAQRAINYNVAVTAAAQPLANIRFECETVILNVPTGGNSVFYGYGSGITSTSGIEVRAGLPIVVGTENQREQWELQRTLEALAAILAFQNGWQRLDEFKAPRVVFNLNEYYVVCAAGTTQTLAVMAFPTPELQ